MPGRTSLVDSHIHLYPSTALGNFNWSQGLPSDHVLNRQNSVDDYRQVISSSSDIVNGFVFVETDRRSGHTDDEEGWKDVLDEVDYVARIAKGQPRSSDGFVAEDAKLTLGMVPWAPIPAGPQVMKKYLDMIQSRCQEGDVHTLVKGFRYLVQDKPQGTMLQPRFIESLKLLAEGGFVFDLGIDQRSGGPWQLQEAAQMLEMVYTEDCRLKMVINHFCKPNLRISTEEADSGHPDFSAWQKHMEVFSKHQDTYMKLSGFFSELPPQEPNQPEPIGSLADRVKPWFDVVVKTFGPRRIMFGSDWPVCQIGGPGPKSWQHWLELVNALIGDFSEEDQARILHGTATEAYNLRIRT